MILWKDFILDDVMGPTLVFAFDEIAKINQENQTESQKCRVSRFGSLGVKDDAESRAIIQETRQEIEPARMVGLSGFESKSSTAQTNTEVGQGNRNNSRLRGEG